jgi:hypothetical protein
VAVKKRFVGMGLLLLYFEDSHSMGLFWGVRNDHITRREIAMRDKPIGSVEFMAQAWQKKWLTISIHAVYT